jgi:predicted ATPase/DNA-binding XRE family transcriptional regulator
VLAAERQEPTFGQLLRELRVAAALTQEELAEVAGLSPRAISDLERGERRSPRHATVRRLAAALRLAADVQTTLENAARPARVSVAANPNTPGLGGPRTSFVGRAREQAEVTRLLAAHRLITLTGVGGIGKTRLALAVAEAAVPDRAASAVLVELAQLSDAVLVPRELASALGLRESADRPIVETLQAALAERSIIIVLDNCEHLLGACARLVDTLLNACPQVRILATSREPLGIAAETTWAVPPLAVGDSDLLSVDRLAQFGAVQLFADRARAVWPTFELSEHNAHAVARVCHRLDGIPLAIELAAARTRVLSVHQIETRLVDRYRLLAWGAPNAPARHQTLLAAVDWSFTLLSEPERLVFDRLSVFRGGWWPDAAEAVCAGRELQPDEVRGVLHALVDKSLVVSAPGPDGSERFGQLETLREYAAGRVAARRDGSVEALGARHLAYFVDVAERAGQALRGPEELAWLDRLDRDHDNLRAALGWAAARDDGLEHALRLAGGIWRFWMVRGHVVEGRRWLEDLLARPSTVPPSVRARALDAAGTLAFQNADYDCAQARLEAALAIYRQLGDEYGVAGVLSHLGSLTFVQGHRARARAMFEESLAASRSIGDRAGHASVLVNLANMARAQADLDEAYTCLAKALELFRELRIRGPEANALHGMGNLAYDRGDLAQAVNCYRDALALAQQVQDWGCVARCIESLAAVSGKQRRPARAAQLYGAVEALREDIGIPITGPRRQTHESFIAFLEGLLGPAALAAAWKRGRALSRERAVSMALGDEGDR